MAKDRDHWIALELSPVGEAKMMEGILPNLLRNAIKGCPKDHEIFVPCIQVHKSGRPFMYKLMEGYVFIKDGFSETDYFRLESTPYIESVMSTLTSEGVKTCLLIPDRDIEKLKHQLFTLSKDTFKYGDMVRVLNGSFSKLSGRILRSWESHSEVYFQFRSLRILKTLKNTSLELLEDESSSIEDSLWSPEFALPRPIFELKDALK